MRARAQWRACAKRYPRSGPCDQDRMEGIRPRGGGERLQAALLLFAAVKSPELGREEEGATANSMAGKGP